MKALVMQAPWVLTVEEVSTPVPGPDDVLVKIAATGICGSDFHGFSGENGRRKPGQINRPSSLDSLSAHLWHTRVRNAVRPSQAASTNHARNGRSANLPSRLGSLL